MCGLASRSCLQHCPDHDLFDIICPTIQPTPLSAAVHTCRYEPGRLPSDVDACSPLLQPFSVSSFGRHFFLRRRLSLCSQESKRKAD